MKTLGFVGAGNMAGAILQGVVERGFLLPDQLWVHDSNPAQCDKWIAKYPLHIAQSNANLAQACDCVVLAVKPVFMQQVLLEIQPYVRGKLVISIAAGWTTSMLRNLLDEDSGAMVLRVMPNTPAMVGEGYTALCQENNLDKESFAWAQGLFETCGKTEVYPERLFDAVIAISGSSPAYAFIMMEAMADGAVRLGMPRAQAYQAAAQAMLGSAKMVLETGLHPGMLKDQVCSPAGTTIEAVYALEKEHFRGAIIAAMDACATKSAEMSQNTRK